jgi:pSer/pThr/pTyr-binding forkhead associated (FHA) protein
MAKVLVIDQKSVTEMQMGQEITIGRAYSNLLRLEGEEVSRVHAIIYRRGADYILRDLDSKNGLLLNGQRVTNSLIAPGDDIQIGNYFIIFDPTESFDLNGFLRKKRIQVPANPTVIKGLDAETGSVEAGDAPSVPSSILNEGASVSFRTPESLLPASGKAAVSDQESLIPRPKTFHALAEIEALGERLLASQHDPKFAFEALKLNAAIPKVLPKVILPDETNNQSCQPLLEALLPILQADRGVIVFQTPGTEQLHLGAILPKDKDVSINRVVLKACLRKQFGVLTGDAPNDPEFAKTETIRKEGIGSIIAYPLVKHGVSFGLIYADTLHRKDVFRREQLVILQMTAVMVTMVVKVEPGSRRD